MFDLSAVQVLMVLVIALLVLGPKRLPEVARGLGKGLREFKGSLGGLKADVMSESAAAPAVADGASTVATNDAEVLEGIVVSGAEQPPRRPAAR